MEAKGFSLLSEIRLKNLHIIYESASQYSVVHVDTHGERHEKVISKETVDAIANRLKGEHISVDEAVKMLEPMINRGLIQLPFKYGHKLRFYIHAVLLVLVAAGRAEQRKVGRAFLYHITEK